MTQLSTKEATPPTASTDDLESLTFGICDRLWDHGYCSAYVVLAPAKADGEPDWEKTDPANVSDLPADEWPDDPALAKRACIIISNIDGCHADSTFIVRLDPSLHVQQIHGAESDRAVAESIIGRDIGIEPVVPPKSKLQESMERLAEQLKAANDNKPKKLLKVVDPADWHGKPIPERDWFLPDLIPARNVTLLSGDGGVGKSLLALQIAAASALGVETMGLRPKAGRVYYLGAEDEEDEFKRRLAQIVVGAGQTLADFGRRFKLAPMAGEDATLALPDRHKNMQPTTVMQEFVEDVTSFRPDLLILDTSADLFGGDEINRVQVRQFVGMLRKIAMGIDCAIILLSHPSIQGMQSGSGLSGSTAWNNSVRSRLYLTSMPDDDEARLLTTVKSNYGKKGAGIKMRWHNGTFSVDDGRPTVGSMLVAAKADRVFIETLEKLFGQGQKLSPSPSATYAPKVISAHPDGGGMSKKELAAAQQRLLDAGRIRIVEDGPASRRTKYLAIVERHTSD